MTKSAVATNPIAARTLKPRTIHALKAPAKVGNVGIMIA